MTHAGYCWLTMSTGGLPGEGVPPVGVWELGVIFTEKLRLPPGIVPGGARRGTGFRIIPGSHPWLFWKVSRKADCEIPRIEVKFTDESGNEFSWIRDLRAGDVLKPTNLIYNGFEPQVLTIAGPGTLTENFGARVNDLPLQ